MSTRLCEDNSERNVEGKDEGESIPETTHESKRKSKDKHESKGGRAGRDKHDDGGGDNLPMSPPPPRIRVVPPQHGYDMSILTLGRIGDGFRRDTYTFDVDLKGRGEGRAAEARAVLQVRLDRRMHAPCTIARRM